MQLHNIQRQIKIKMETHLKLMISL